jgi:hypothetical protein
MEELYGILEKAHKETGHGGRDRIWGYMGFL